MDESICRNGTPHPRTDDCETFTCDHHGCNKRFCTYKRMRIHAVKHAKAHCSKCGRVYSRKGVATHEQACNGPDSAPATTEQLVPTEMMVAVLADFLRFAADINPEHVVVFPAGGSPEIRRREDAARIAYTCDRMMLVIPASQLPVPSKPQRWRRKQKAA